MKESDSKPLKQPQFIIPASLRDLGFAFEHISDVNHFTGLLQDGIAKMLNVTSASIMTPFKSIEQTEKSSEPPHPHFKIPLVANNDLLGVLNIYGKKGGERFGPQDLHLMAALSDFTAAIVKHAVSHGEKIRLDASKKLLLENLSCGVIGTDVKGKITVFNNVAGRLLLHDPSAMFKKGMEILPAEIAEGLKSAIIHGETCKQAAFYIEKHGCFIGGSIAPIFDEGEKTTGAVIIFNEIRGVEKCDVLLDSLKDEIKRSERYNRPLTVVIFSSVESLIKLFSLIKVIKRYMRSCDICGRYEKDKIALVLPETLREGATALLCRLRSVLDSGNYTVGMATWPDDGRTVQELIAAACNNMERVSTTARKTILAYDEYSSINDTLELILGDDYRILKSVSYSKTYGYIEQKRVDGLISELEGNGELSGLILVKRIKSTKPNIKAFLTSSVVTPEREKAALESGALALFEKPFDVLHIYKTIYEAIGV